MYISYLLGNGEGGDISGLLTMYNTWWNNWWKNWTIGWKNWLPDPAKIYVAGDSGLPIKLNPIFRGAQSLPTIETDLCSVIMPFSKKEIDGSEIDFVKPAFESAGLRVSF